MALAFKIAKLEDVAEAFRPLYVKTTDGTYQLEVSGAVDKSVVDEFRTKNIELLKDAEKFKDLNPAKYQELLELDRKRQEKELLDKGEIDTVVNNRVQAMRSDYEKQVAELTKSGQTMTKQLETLLIDNAIRAAATKNGIRPEAVDDVLLRAKTVFSIREGKVMALDGESKPVYGKDGTTPLGTEEWLGGLKATAPHLYLSSQGGGSNNGAGGGNFNGGSTSNLKGVSKIAAGLSDGFGE